MIDINNIKIGDIIIAKDDGRPYKIIEFYPNYRYTISDDNVYIRHYVTILCECDNIDRTIIMDVRTEIIPRVIQ